MNKPQITILVIDDEPGVLESVRDFLEDREFEVLTASNGRSGIETFLRHKPDIVFTDLRMPEMDGLEVLERLTRISVETPVIIVSGTGNITDSVQALRLGAWDYLLKPIDDLSIILSTIDKVMDRVRLRRENRLYKEHLEDLVRRRTLELEQANSHLAGINTRLKKIVETTRHLTIVSEVSRFGETLLCEFAEHMLAAGGSMFLRESGGLRLLHTLDRHHVPEFIPFPLADDSVLRRVLESGNTLLISDINGQSELVSSGWDGYRNGSALIFPLPDENGEVVGILSLHSKTPPPFVEQDREIGSILASFSSEAIRTIRSVEMLRASEERLHTMFRSSPDYLILLDLNLRISYMNRAVPGYSVDSIIGKYLYDVVESKDKDRVRMILDRVVGFAEEQRYDVSFTRHDGSVLHFSSIVAPIVIDNKVTGLVVNSRDVTLQFRLQEEKAQLEEKVRQAQKMESIGRLAGGVAHDLNNLLTPIIGYCDMMLENANPNWNWKPCAGEVMQAGLRARDIVHQLLAFSRKQTLCFQPMSVNEAVHDIMKLLKRTIPEDIVIRIDLSEDVPTVVADKGQIGQVIMNLSVNAADAMQNGGILSIDTRVVDTIGESLPVIDSHPAGGYVLLTIRDTGCGMDAEIREHIFEPFFTTKGDKGTGLGLATVYGIVKQHRGFVFIDSAPGKGTRVSVYLPVAAKDPDEAMVPDIRPMIVEGTETVLLVEDNDHVRRMVDNLLADKGYRTHVAASGDEALKILQTLSEPVHLLLTDVVLPGINGRDLYLAAAKVMPDIRVLYMSGYTDEVIAHKGVLDRDVSFIQKPFSIQQLLSKVREVLGNR